MFFALRELTLQWESEHMGHCGKREVSGRARVSGGQWRGISGHKEPGLREGPPEREMSYGNQTFCSPLWTAKHLCTASFGPTVILRGSHCPLCPWKQGLKN